MQDGPHDARPCVDAEDRADVGHSRAGREKRLYLVGREPQREGDPFADGFLPDLPVVVAVQPFQPVPVLETEREPFRGGISREMERCERIGGLA